MFPLVAIKLCSKSVRTFLLRFSGFFIVNLDNDQLKAADS